MNRSVLQMQSSPVQQMIMSGNPNNWWNMRPPAPSHPFFSTTPSNFLTPYPTSSLPLPSWHENQELPQSWSQLLMSGVVCEEDEASICELQVHESKKMENWEEQMKQESSVSSYVYGHGNGSEEFAKPTWSQIMPAASSNSCAQSFSSSNSMLDFSNKNTDTRPPPSSDPSSECNRVAGGGALKKARVQQSTTQPTFKVRKEKLGDKITALHQLVSPFGKTDTASVLLEAIGYIRFLQSQIQALSLPYLGSGSGNMRHQQSVQRDESCIFPEDPGQLLNENCLKRKAASEQECKEEEKKDLRSRGLCLVPVSCTLQIGNENGADYWAPGFGGGFR